jgi:hypothetical protein
MMMSSPVSRAQRQWSRAKVTPVRLQALMLGHSARAAPARHPA